MKTLPHNFVVVSVFVFLSFFGLFFSFFSVARPGYPPLPNPPNTTSMTIIIKSEKSKRLRLLSLKIAHQNGINIVDKQAGVAEGGVGQVQLRGVKAGQPSINLSAKFFISPPKKTHVAHGTWNMECAACRGKNYARGAGTILRIVWVAVKQKKKKTGG